MAVDVVIWDSAVVRDGVVLNELVNVEKQFQLRKGVSRQKGFPEDAAFTMDPDFPNNTLLVDNLMNTDGMIVASSRLQALLKQNGVQHVEFLPVTILNPKGKPYSKEYAIVHPVDLIECIDLERSRFDWSTIIKTDIAEMYELTLKPDALPADRLLFKPKHYPRIILVRQQLADAISDAGITGVQWIQVSKHRTHA